MVYFVTSRIEAYKDYKFEENNMELVTSPVFFARWMFENPWVNLDTETSMEPDGPMAHVNRKLYVVSIGSIDQEDQFIFDMVDLEDQWLSRLRAIFMSPTSFILHNARFDYTVISSNLDVQIENVHDTFLMSKILNTGYDLPRGYHSLAGCLKRFLDVEISKEQQTTFDGNPLTIEQIEYAAIDVLFSYQLYSKLEDLLDSWKLFYLYDKVERHVLKTYADMELNPMKFDKDYWDTLSMDFIDERNKLGKELNDTVVNDVGLIAHLKHSKVRMNTDLIQLKDEYKMNWASTLFKKDAFKVLAPSLPTDVKTKPAIKKYLKETTTLPLEERTILNHYMNRDYEKLNDMLINDHDDFLLNNSYFIKKDTLLINWASAQHKLYIFQHYYPNLEDTNAKSLVRIRKNKLINTFKKWVEAEKKVTSYGKGFVTKYVRDDNTIAPFNLRQILNTGRISFGILLQMPAEARFRNAFLPPEDDWVFIDTDYSSIEVLLAAYAANEHHFLNAVKKGLDLHSMSASMMFEDTWKDIAEDGCEQIKTGKRCKCKEHQKFRDFSKTVTFGLFYGIGPVGLSDRLGISNREAADLIDKFFTAFPKFKVFFNTNEQFGMNNNRIVGLAPTNRIRFFHPPTEPGEKSSIGRASKNFPIQEASASILKLALIKLRSRILAEDLEMKIHLPIHDEILSSCPKEDASTIALIQEEVMIEAAEEFLQKNLVDVDTKILNRWSK